MNRLQHDQRFKITTRNHLGIRTASTDDWIFSFNIGNIMHLQAMSFDDLEIKLQGVDLKNETILTGESSKSFVGSQVI